MIYKSIGGFKIKDYTIIALVSAVLFLMEVFLSAVGGTLPMIIFVCFVDIIFSVLLVLLVRRFGVLAISALISATLALPTPAYGIPGLAKYPLLLSAGILMEIVILALQKRQKLALMMGGIVALITNFIAYYILATQLGLPAPMSGLIGLFVLISIIIGSLGGYCGYLVYKRIENKQLIKQFRD